MLHRIVVNVGDAKISRDSRDVLVTYGLGSCIGVCMYDPVACLGALVHSQLPDSRMNEAKHAFPPLGFSRTQFGLGPGIVRLQLRLGNFGRS